MASQEWDEDELLALCTKAYPYRDLSGSSFNPVVNMLSEGYVPGRRRQQAHVFHDRVQHQIRPKRGRGWRRLPLEALLPTRLPMPW